MTLNREVLKSRLVVSEGVRMKPYRDTVGKLTIGVGRNLDDRGLSPAEVDYLLENDIDIVIDDLNRRIPWWTELDPVRQSVLADMCFNLGINKLLGFVNTLRMVKQGDYLAAANGMLNSLWARQVGNRAVHLAQMMRSGI